MMERYTPQAQEALGLAVEVAEGLNHGYVGTEHLLIGLLQELLEPQMTLVLPQGLEPLEPQSLGLLELQHLLQLKEP